MQKKTKTKAKQKLETSANWPVVAFAIEPKDKELIHQFAEKADRTLAAQCRRMLHHLLQDQKVCAGI